ncbi:Fc.00g104180.m01.CDS01 [Cosmosporella sp. VM-42]
MKISKEKSNPEISNSCVHDSSTSDNEHMRDELDHGTHDLQSGSAEPVKGDNIFTQGGKNYRTFGRWDTIFCLFTNQVGLGILSLPSVLSIMGIVPGIIAIVGIGCLSWYTAFELLQFYEHHQHVVNVVEMTRVVGGPWFEMFAGIFMMIQVVFVASSAVVTLSIALNTISAHATCTVVFIFASCVTCYSLSMPRTMKFVSYSGIPNAVSVLVAVLVVMISLGVSGPASAPPGWDKKIVVVDQPDFRDGLNCCLKVVYAYASNIAFVGYMAEMIDPVKDFGFCLGILEVGSMILYVVIAIVIYCLSGQYITSPALGTAPEHWLRLPAALSFRP